MTARRHRELLCRRAFYWGDEDRGSGLEHFKIKMLYSAAFGKKYEAYSAMPGRCSGPP